MSSWEESGQMSSIVVGSLSTFHSAKGSHLTPADSMVMFTHASGSSMVEP